MYSTYIYVFSSRNSIFAICVI